jgi:hypothetical protein
MYLVHVRFFFVLSTCLLLVVLCVSAPSFSQNYAKGDKDINLGIGIASYYGSGYRIGLPPVTASFELGVTDEIGVGALVGFSTARTKKYNFISGEYWWRYTSITIAPRAAYHFSLEDMDKFDLYAGVMGGLRIGSSTFHSTDPTLNGDNFKTDAAGGILFGVFGGGRYQASEKLRLFAELGWGVTWLNFGLNFKLASNSK